VPPGAGGGVPPRLRSAPGAACRRVCALRRGICLSGLGRGLRIVGGTDDPAHSDQPGRGQDPERDVHDRHVLRSDHRHRGSFTRSAALGSLTPALRKQIEPLLKLVSGDIRFNAWIDAEHVVRRVTEVETVSGETVHSTINVTSVNRPVHVTPPPASETVVPKSDPGGM
jgi:hypothetical protein